MIDFFQKLIQNRYVRRLSIPAVVIFVVVIMFLTAPWQIPEEQDDSPGNDEVIAGPIAIATPTPLPTATPEPTLPPEATPTPAPLYDGTYNPLTGEPWDKDTGMNRPWAFSIGATSLPLLGIGGADIICEYPIEDGETRFNVMFQDVSDLDKIIGIRSLRTSNMRIAEGFDAIFVHWLGRTENNVIPTGSPITRYDTFNAAAYDMRWSGEPRKYGEHNAYITGKKLLDSLPEDFRTAREEQTFHPFKFAEDGTPQDGISAEKVIVSFSNFTSRKKEFNYDENAGVYYVQHNGRNLIDGLTNKRLSFTNVIVMQTGMTPRVNGSHTRIRSTGEDDGYFICGGKAIEITWSRDEKPSEAPFKFFLKDGTPLTFGIGKTFICFIHDTQEPVFE